MMDKSISIVGVGHNCLDYLCTVEKYPAEDSSTHITSIEIQGGGAVATAMAAASRLGVSAGILGCLGDDSAGCEVIDLLKKDKVDTNFITIVPNGRSSVSYVMVNPLNGTRTKFPYHDELPLIEWTDNQQKLIKSSKILHLDGTNYDNAVKAAEIAKEAGVFVSLDGCSMQKDNKKNRDLASMADILIMNSKYPLTVSKKSSYEEALKEISTWGPRIVISTLGKDGLLAVIDREVVHFPAYQINAIDTTGAGDVFHGAFLAGFLRKMDLIKNIKFASAVSAIKCTSIGGRKGIPSYDEALKFLLDNK